MWGNVCVATFLACSFWPAPPCRRLPQRAEPSIDGSTIESPEMRAVRRVVFQASVRNSSPQRWGGSGFRRRPTLSADRLRQSGVASMRLRSQLRTLTGQVEDQGNRTRQLEDQMARLRLDIRHRSIDRRSRVRTNRPHHREGSSALRLGLPTAHPRLNRPRKRPSSSGGSAARPTPPRKL